MKLDDHFKTRRIDRLVVGAAVVACAVIFGMTAYAWIVGWAQNMASLMNG